MKVWLRLLPVGATALALVLALGYGFSKPQPFIVNNVLLPIPKALPAFELRSTGGELFTPEAFLGQWSLLFSGYTQCPDVCPATLSLLSQLQRDWPDTAPQLVVVFVTVDPQQDSLANIRVYLDYFGAQMVGLTGSEGQLNRLLSGIGFYPVSASPSGLLNHSGAVALINPQGQLHALFRAPLTLARLQGQLQQILVLP